MTVKNICQNFQIEGNYVGYQSINSGNINQTFLVVYLRDNQTQQYIIQKINKYVFKLPEKVMENVLGVTEHIKSRLIKSEVSIEDLERRVLYCILTKKGETFYKDSVGDFWRCYNYVNDSISFDNSNSETVIENTGKAFGDFQKLLSDFDSSKLHETIKDFHNTKKRFENFNNVVERDKNNRVKNVLKEIDFIRSKEELADTFSKLIKRGDLPLRVTHNDTKCNNVLFDKTSLKPLVVVDLDTVMQGSFVYDFGDGVRSIAATADEDEIILDKIDLNFKKFSAFSKGYLSKIADCITGNELEYLAEGALIMTVELALRFLEDYINGDVYFKIRMMDHNLIRARNQIELARKIEKNLPKLKRVIKELY